MEDSPAPVVEDLNAEQLAALHDFASQRLSTFTTPAMDLATLTQIINRLKPQKQEKSTPVLRCESLFQVVAMETMLALRMVSADPDLLQKISMEMKDPLWQRMFERLFEQLPGLDLPVGAKSDTWEKSTLLGEELDSTSQIVTNATVVSQATEALKDQLSLRTKLKLRDAFMQAQDMANLNEIVRGNDFVRSQFGLVQLATLVDNQISEQFENQLSDELKATVVQLCEGLTNANPMAALFLMGQNRVKRNMVKELFGLLGDTRFSSAMPEFNFPALAYAVKFLPVKLDDQICQTVRDWTELSRNCFHISWCSKLITVCDRPISVSQNERGRLHNSAGPALEFKDGSKVYALDGVVMPPNILDTESITLAQIDSEQNVEVRRLLIQRYGEIKYLQDAGAVEIDSDSNFGTLYKKAFMQDEPMVMVKVKNTTPEPDGTHKFYFLRVPPFITTARAAVAWTFNMKPEEYSPLSQS